MSLRATHKGVLSKTACHSMTPLRPGRLAAPKSCQKTEAHGFPPCDKPWTRSYGRQERCGGRRRQGSSSHPAALFHPFPKCRVRSVTHASALQENSRAGSGFGFLNVLSDPFGGIDSIPALEAGACGYHRHSGNGYRPLRNAFPTFREQSARHSGNEVSTFRERPGRTDSWISRDSRTRLCSLTI